MLGLCLLNVVRLIALHFFQSLSIYENKLPHPSKQGPYTPRASARWFSPSFQSVFFVLLLSLQLASFLRASSSSLFFFLLIMVVLLLLLLLLVCSACVYIALMGILYHHPLSVFQSIHAKIKQMILYTSFLSLPSCLYLSIYLYIQRQTRTRLLLLLLLLVIYRYFHFKFFLLKMLFHMYVRICIYLS